MRDLHRDYGRLALGEFLLLHVECSATNGVALAPTAAPNYTIYDSAGSAVTGASAVKMVPQDKGVITGFFWAEHRLGSNFSAGRYAGVIQWANSGDTYAEAFSFEVVGGGHTSSGYVGLEFHCAPQADYVVGLPESGTLEQRKNPSV